METEYFLKLGVFMFVHLFICVIMFLNESAYFTHLERQGHLKTVINEGRVNFVYESKNTIIEQEYE